MIFDPNVLPFIIALLSSFSICWLICLTQGIHGRWTHDSHSGVQKVHTLPTPRIGGLGIFVALVAAYVAASIRPNGFLNPDALKIVFTMLMAGSICFFVGLAEDITKRVSVSARLLACMISAVVAIIYSGVSIQRVNIPGIDQLLSYAPAWANPILPVALVFTCFAIAGLANAFNIVDGFNGLSSGIAVVVCIGVFLIAGKVGDHGLAWSAALLAAAIVGFWLLNWPFGKLFLGDGGAYFVGFCVAWLIVLLPARNPEVSPWASLSLIIYLVAEVLFSVIRRLRRQGHHPGAPDKVHMHHLIHSRLVRKYFGRTAGGSVSNLANGTTAMVLIAFNVLIMSFSAIFYHSQISLTILCFSSYLIYIYVYRRLVYFR